MKTFRQKWQIIQIGNNLKLEKNTNDWRIDQKTDNRSQNRAEFFLFFNGKTKMEDAHAQCHFVFVTIHHHAMSHNQNAVAARFYLRIPASKNVSKCMELKSKTSYFHLQHCFVFLCSSFTIFCKMLLNINLMLLFNLNMSRVSNL